MGYKYISKFNRVVHLILIYYDHKSVWKYHNSYRIIKNKSLIIIISTLVILFIRLNGNSSISIELKLSTISKLI